MGIIFGYALIDNFNQEHRDLIDLKNELEQKVDERTAELRQSKKEIEQLSQQKTDFFVKAVDLLMGKEFHESGLTTKDLYNLKIDHAILREEIKQITNTNFHNILPDIYQNKIVWKSPLGLFFFHSSNNGWCIMCSPVLSFLLKVNS